jgi:osmotically inducible lipoprotein OsmB
MDMKMTFRKKQTVAALLTVVLLMGTLGAFNVNAQRYSRRHYHSTHHSRTKGALIGGAVGLIGGALIGGKRGALIGAGAGAGTGYLIQRHRNNRNRRYRRYYRRY